jgi:pimeloyl-ACP methyl ester carboxylesterase
LYPRRPRALVAAARRSWRSQRPLLPRIIAPTLVVAGEEDCLVAPVASQELAEGLAHGRIVVLADAGPYPWVDQPDPFRSAVSAFLDGS